MLASVLLFRVGLYAHLLLVLLLLLIYDLLPHAVNVVAAIL